MAPKGSGRTRRDRVRGQAIVLIAVTASIVAFTLMTTLAIGTAIHRKIQLQQAADAASYSLAVQEARAFNFYAFSNRAILSHYVAMMAIYGHMSYLASYEGYLDQVSCNWGCGSCSGFSTYNITYQLYTWTGLYAACYAASWFTDVQCLDCMWTEFNEAQNIQNNFCQQIDTKLQQVDQDLGKSGGGSSIFTHLRDEARGHMAIASTWADTQDAYDAALQLQFGTSNLQKGIASGVDADHSIKVPNEVLVGMLNRSGGPGTPGYCSATTTAGCGLGGKGLINTQRAASNASRHGPMPGGGDWLTNRNVQPASVAGGLIELNLSSLFGYNIAEYQNVVNGNGMSRMIHSARNEANTVTHQAGGEGGFSLTGEDHGKVTDSSDLEPLMSGACMPGAVFWQGDFNTWAYSEPKSLPADMGGGEGQSELRFADGTTQTPNSGLDLDFGGGTGAADTAHGVLLSTANFLIQTYENDPLFNQPRTWGILEDTVTPANEGPFAIKTKTGLGSARHVYDNEITDRVPWGSILAISQGLAYYHRPGNWQEPPNYYNPYWRAKLHPFLDQRSVEAALLAAGHPGILGAATALPETE